MPYLVMVYAPDDHAANQAMGAINLMSNYDTQPPRVVGLYDFPARAEVECPGFTCPEQRRSGDNNFGYGRHHTGQHIVHGACQRRRKGFRRRVALALMDLFGVNLLPREITPGLFKNPTNYDRPDAFPPIEP